MFINQNFTTKEQEVKVCSFKKCISREELEELMIFLGITSKIQYKSKKSSLVCCCNKNREDYFLKALINNEGCKIHLTEIDTRRTVCEGDYLVKFSNNQIKTFSKEEFQYKEDDCSEEYLSKLVEFLTEGKKKKFEATRLNVMEDKNFIIVLHKDPNFFFDKRWIEVNLKYNGNILPVLHQDYIVKQDNVFVTKHWTEVEK